MSKAKPTPRTKAKHKSAFQRVTESEKLSRPKRASALTPAKPTSNKGKAWTKGESKAIKGKAFIKDATSGKFTRATDKGGSFVKRVSAPFKSAKLPPKPSTNIKPKNPPSKGKS